MKYIGKRIARSLARTFAPQMYWKRQLHLMQADYHEPELALVGVLSSPSMTSVDIGAAGGVYVAHMLKSSKNCMAFEPGPGAAASLETMVRVLSLPVQVERVALSDHAGEARMRVLTSDLGRSTIEEENKLDDPDGSSRSEVDVPVRRLDDYLLASVGFIKIDVEGHELAVLRGGTETIKRELPNILVEVEDRHKPGATKNVFEMLERHGYNGFFILSNRLVQLSEFDINKHQNAENIGGWRSGWKRTGIYINNFIFVPSNTTDLFLARATEALDRLP